MNNPLRYHIADARLTYNGRHEPMEMSKEKISTFNLRHREVLDFYGPGQRALEPWRLQG